MKELIKTLFNNLIYQLYSIVIWAVVFLLTYKWYLLEITNYHCTIKNTIGIILVFKILNGVKYFVAPKEENIDTIQSSNMNVFNPYIVLLFSFIFHLI